MEEFKYKSFRYFANYEKGALPKIEHNREGSN